MAFDPMTGAVVPAMNDPSTLNPFAAISAGPPVPVAPPVMTPPIAAPGAMGQGPHSWSGMPGNGLLQMLQRVQAADPARFAAFMQSPMAARFGLTPDNLAGMQSKQDFRQQFQNQHHMGFGMMPPQGMPPVATGAPIMGAPAAPVAPQPAGFAAQPNPLPGVQY